MNTQEAITVLIEAKSKMAGNTSNPTISAVQYRRILRPIKAEFNTKTMRDIMDAVEDHCFGLRCNLKTPNNN